MIISDRAVERYGGAPPFPNAGAENEEPPAPFRSG